MGQRPYVVRDVHAVVTWLHFCRTSFLVQNLTQDTTVHLVVTSPLACDHFPDFPCGHDSFDEPSSGICRTSFGWYLSDVSLVSRWRLGVWGGRPRKKAHFLSHQRDVRWQDTRLVLTPAPGWRTAGQAGPLCVPCSLSILSSLEGPGHSHLPPQTCFQLGRKCEEVPE